MKSPLWSDIIPYEFHTQPPAEAKIAYYLIGVGREKWVKSRLVANSDKRKIKKKAKEKIKKIKTQITIATDAKLVLRFDWMHTYVCVFVNYFIIRERII